jgi:putative resolvase
MPKISINEAAKVLGVHTDTLRRWEESGKIKPERTVGGHRRYDLAELIGVENDSGLTICYARVSSRPQKKDLETQAAVLSAYCQRMAWKYETIKDIGSGINYNKKGLTRLIELITTNQVKRLVLTHKDRLLRFGAEIIFALCSQFAVEVVILNRPTDSSPEQDLVQDVLEIITQYGSVKVLIPPSPP